MSINLKEKNPFPQETPEWQLFELAASASSQETAFANDAENFQKKAAAARTKKDAFVAALEKLTAP